MTFKRIYIEITNACNLDCSFCHNNKRVKKFMSVDSFNHIIEEIKPYTNYIYLHVKGEPLLHPELDKILSLCDENKISANITTNGTLLKKNKEVLNRHHSLRQINISLHDEFNSDYDEILNSCDEVSNSLYINYRIWTLENKKISGNKQMLVDKIISHYNLETEIAHKIYSCDNIKLAENIFLSKDNMFDWPSLDNDNISDGYCLGTISHIGILVDGSVVPCCLDGEGVINLGNIFDSSLSDIMSSKRFLEMNSSFRNNKCSEELCKKCTYKNRFRK